LVDAQVSVELWPLLIVVGLAESVAVGIGGGVTGETQVPVNTGPEKIGGVDCTCVQVCASALPDHSRSAAITEL